MEVEPAPRSPCMPRVQSGRECRVEPLCPCRHDVWATPIPDRRCSGVWVAMHCHFLTEGCLPVNLNLEDMYQVGTCPMCMHMVVSSTSILPRYPRLMSIWLPPSRAPRLPLRDGGADWPLLKRFGWASRGAFTNVFVCWLVLLAPPRMSVSGVRSGWDQCPSPSKLGQHPKQGRGSVVRN